MKYFFGGWAIPLMWDKANLRISVAEWFNADQNSDIVSGSQLVLTFLHLSVVCKKVHKVQKNLFSENTFQTCTTNCCMKSKGCWNVVWQSFVCGAHEPQPVMFDLQSRLNIGLFYKSAVDLWICLGMLIFCHSLLQRANSFSRSFMAAPRLRRVLHSESPRLIWA